MVRKVLGIIIFIILVILGFILFFTYSSSKKQTEIKIEIPIQSEVKKEETKKVEKGKTEESKEEVIKNTYKPIALPSTKNDALINAIKEEILIYEKEINNSRLILSRKGEELNKQLENEKAILAEFEKEYLELKNEYDSAYQNYDDAKRKLITYEQKVDLAQKVLEENKLALSNHLLLKPQDESSVSYNDEFIAWSATKEQLESKVREANLDLDNSQNDLLSQKLSLSYESLESNLKEKELIFKESDLEYQAKIKIINDLVNEIQNFNQTINNNIANYRNKIVELEAKLKELN